MTQIDNKLGESHDLMTLTINKYVKCTMLKSDRLVFGRCFPAETMTQNVCLMQTYKSLYKIHTRYNLFIRKSIKDIRNTID